jgi:hypothetical protein
MNNSKLITMSQQAKGVETRILDCGGRRLASIEGPNGSALDFYSLGKTVVIVQDFADLSGIGRDGCEVFFSRPETQMKAIYAALDEVAKQNSVTPRKIQEERTL